MLKSTTSAFNYCARKGAGTSMHFVTGEFHYSHPRVDQGLHGIRARPVPARTGAVTGRQPSRLAER
ncbi:hypothetical protein ACWGCW_10980 [Streptomyces sp. NPDC054933]